MEMPMALPPLQLICATAPAALARPTASDRRAAAGTQRWGPVCDTVIVLPAVRRVAAISSGDVHEGTHESGPSPQVQRFKVNNV